MTSVYLDSCVVIGLIEGDAEQRQALRHYLAFSQTVFSDRMREAHLIALITTVF
jgi:hypothetical protein